MLELFNSLDLNTGILLFFSLFFVLFYEMINGFHDTANAITTIIYTRSMKSQLAVVTAAVFNFLGVLLGGLGVAYAIVHMLPTHLLLDIGSKHGIVMIFCILLAAIIWNLSTWYFGLPASSSHTLIGSIIGIGLTNAILLGVPVIDAFNISEIFNVFVSLFFSPMIGLLFAGILILILRKFWQGTGNKESIHLTPKERDKKDGKKKPPFWIRIALILCSISVAFSHGANDGQKGIGLAMLVLMSIAPSNFIVNTHASSYEITRTQEAISNLEFFFQRNPEVLKKIIHPGNQSLTDTRNNTSLKCCFEDINSKLEKAESIINNITDYKQVDLKKLVFFRRAILHITDIVDKVLTSKEITAEEKQLMQKLKRDMLESIEYAPLWVITAVAFSLCIGTMIGWRRVAVTVGEKIGKKSMTYAQGMASQVTAAISIGCASYMGTPVSTTHVVSSSVAGAMIIDRCGLQKKTVTNIIVTWVITLPAAILLSSILYYCASMIIIS